MPYAGEMHYRGSIPVEGDRHNLILIHGAGGSYMYWPPEIRHLPAGGILAVDLPGHGASIGDCKGRIADYAYDLMGFMDQLQIEQAVLGGHSMGSAVALRMSLDYPERVMGLILVGAGAKLGVHPQLIRDAGSRETYPRAVSQILDWSFSQVADQNLVRLAGARMMDIPPQLMLADLEACNAFDVRHEVGQITKPTLIICGQEDQMTPVKSSAFLADQIQGSRLEIIPAAGHMVMLERPRQIAGLIDQFMGEN
jgi:pimeloyl-ACP methyl ester carboxylesterase